MMNGEINMLLKYNRVHNYNLIDESKVETGCGGLYQAQDYDLQRTVAIKQVKIEGDNIKEKKLFYQKAISEVRAMVRLSEEDIAIPTIFDTYFDEKKNELYIIMEWIKGNTLVDHMNAPELAYLQWIIDLCDILAIMDRKHIYHKDIKPSNIMITDKKKLYLIDFNISISTPNLIEGTTNYKAPEMAVNSKYTGREKVDMFSLGVLLYEYYTGKVPIKTIDYAKNRSRGEFVWDTFIQPIEKVQTMNQEINDIIVKCMRLNPKQRYRNYSELKNELGKVVKKIRWNQKKR